MKGRPTPGAATICTMLAGLAAALALTGWAAGEAGLTGLWLGGRLTPPLTALTLLSVVLAFHAGRHPRTRPVAVALSGVAVAITGTVLVEAIFGLDLGFDDLIAPGHLAAWHVSGRPSPQAAIVFLSIALATALRTTERGHIGAELAAVVAATVSAVTLVGLACGWDILTSVDPRSAATVVAMLGGLALATSLIDPFDGALRRAPTTYTWFAGSVAVALSVVATLGVAHDARVSADREQRVDLRLAADETQTATGPVIDALDDLATLYAPGREVPQRQLTLAAGKLLRRPVVTVVSVLKVVPSAERAAFERRYGPIVEPDGSAAPVRPSYTVIIEGRSRTRRTKSSGVYTDVSNDPERAPALAASFRTGRATATAPIREIKTGRPAVAVYLPVTELAGRSTDLRVAVLFDTAALSRTISGALPPGIDAQISDDGIGFLGGIASEPGSDPTTTVAVAGRAWRVNVDRVEPARAGVLAAASVGLTMTLLLMLSVALLVRRERVAHALAVRGARERDVAARAAVKARRRSRFLEENAADILLLIGPARELTYVSPASRPLLGLSPEQLLGRTLAELAHPDEAERIDESLGQLHRTDAVLDVTHRVRHRDGQWLWVETLLRAVRDPVTGEFLEAQGSMRDVTRRREVERRLREAENRFRSAFDEAPLGMAVVGLDGEILQINRALSALAGWEDHALRGTAFDALLHQADADTHRQAREALLDGELRAHNAELRVVQPSGHVVWTAVSTALVLGGDGQPVHYLTQVQDVSERRRAEAQLQYLADHDPLTGLLNRRAFERSLREHLTRVRRYGVHGAVLVVDLDGFKAINDRIGHGRGDEVIVDVAHALRSRLRDSDLLARFGGDEFAVLLPQADLQEALTVGGALVDAVRGVHPEEDGVALTASVGMALVDRPELRGDELLIDADLAMYDAKQAGRDRVRQSYRSPLNMPRTRVAVDLAELIREAMGEDRLVLFAEPVTDLETGAVTQLELLLRMRGRDGDLHSPASFLAVAEHHDLIQDLDRWVIGEAARLLAAHPDGPSLSVNISVRSLTGETLVDTLGAELTAHRADARRLSIELSESEAVAHLPRVQELARDLRHLGCPLALDDFGGGFGSFYYLKHLPFDVLKIDGGFVRHCADEHADQVVIRSMVEMARGVGAATIAKFVGDQATVDTLHALGVDAAQGYHFAGPVPVLEALENVRARRGGD